MRMPWGLKPQRCSAAAQSAIKSKKLDEGEAERVSPSLCL